MKSSGSGQRPGAWSGDPGRDIPSQTQQPQAPRAWVSVSDARGLRPRGSRPAGRDSRDPAGCLYSCSCGWHLGTNYGNLLSLAKDLSALGLP